MDVVYIDDLTVSLYIKRLIASIKKLKTTISAKVDINTKPFFIKMC